MKDTYDDDAQSAAGLPLRPLGTLPPKGDDDDSKRKAKRGATRAVKRKMRSSTRK